MVRRNGCRAAWWAVAACVGVGGWGGGAAVALTPNRFIVFGDSLSDVGNIQNATLGFVPGRTYFDGRFSNGPAWVEWLAGRFGVGPVLPSTAGGDNFAYGGAETAGDGILGGLFIRNLDDQLSDYLGSRPVDPSALYVVWAGANDLFGGQNDVSVPIARVVATLESLTALGARQFLVPNLPILGKIPEYNRDPIASAHFDDLSHDYNDLFAGAMEQLAARHTNATYYQLDVGELFSNAIANPAAWGLTNVVDPAAPGLDPGAIFYNRNRIVAHPEQYLFWDTIHPTAVVHRILGEVASRLVAGVPGDFDTDGEVDGRDFALWGSGLGAADAVLRQGDADGDRDVDGADFLAWQRTVGTNLASAPGAGGAVGVPEPGRGVLALWGGLLMWGRRPRAPFFMASA